MRGVKPRLCALALALLLVLPFLLCTAPAFARREETGVRILFTHDMHSHLSGEDAGGFARLKTAVDAARAPDAPAILVDAGDFSMGTLYQAVFETHAAELTLMARLGYDAVTLGNHEYDYRAQGLCGMLRAAKANAQAADDSLPALLNANIDWAKSTSEDALALRAAMDDYGAKACTVIERGGVKIGLFGVMGVDSQACAPLAPVAFTPLADAAKAAVKELKAQGAELIVCLSHTGTWSDIGQSEDEQLALAVPEIDVIVSGHTHSVLPTPIRHGDTLIVSCGDYTQNLGELLLTRADNGRWTESAYTLHALDESVAQDAQMQAAVAEYRALVDRDFLARYDLSFDQTLCQSPYDFSANESAQGDLMADAMIAAVKAAQGDGYAPVAFAVVPSGVVRGAIARGAVTVPDAFNILSLGIGPDRVPGYPLISIYLTGRELYDMAEVDASVSRLMGGVSLSPAGGGWTYHDNRLLLSRVSEVFLYGEDGQKHPVEANRLYRVIADLYSGQMLGAVKKSSFGLLSITPKDASGNPVTDFEAHIVRDSSGVEVKAWVAFASYLRALGGADGTGEIPAGYGAPSVRVTQEPASLGSFFRHSGRILYLLAGAVLTVLLLITGIALLIRRAVRKRRARRAKR